MDRFLTKTSGDNTQVKYLNVLLELLSKWPSLFVRATIIINGQVARATQ